ncbi:hypothetical protein KSP40_PGU020995 [Platanthera guangdongensis]|uniref:Uncharacterized protein n=1 Tax=Platanthera guangdongensis TaxID=2320717 RepID=A0ABR2LVA4_9ASPA
MRRNDSWRETVVPINRKETRMPKFGSISMESAFLFSEEIEFLKWMLEIAAADRICGQEIESTFVGVSKVCHTVKPCNTMKFACRNNEYNSLMSVMLRKVEKLWNKRYRG